MQCMWLIQEIWGFMITWILRLSAWADAKSHSLHLFDFSPLCFQMSVQIACLTRCKDTLFTLIWFFSTVCFQMSPQMAHLSECKVTLVTFVCCFSTVRFQMSPQMSGLRGCIITWIAFARHSPLWVFKCVLKWCMYVNTKSHWLHLFKLMYRYCVFSNESSNCMPERMHSHIGYIC